MLQLRELVELCYEVFGFRPCDLPYLVIPFIVTSFAIPLLAWELRRRRRITTDSQRRLEVAWLEVTSLVATIGWAIWAIDYCFRSSEYITPLVYLACLLIALAVLINSGVRQWRQKQCLGVKHLLAALLTIALHLLLFYACVVGVAFIGFRLAFPNAGIMFAFAIPEWFGSVVLVIAITLYAIIAVLVVPAIRRRTRRRWHAASPPVTEHRE